MELGNVLRTMRLKRGLSQEQMAEQTYISRSTISKLENGIMKISGEDLIRWCQITQHQEVLMAIMCGLDMALVHHMLDVATSGIIGTILGGITCLF